ncbi:MAG: hypothetical protein O6844_06330 [Gammaproteobacteria bacterium]|nr:hypothetical protein [Gammaproteobacteria bacterium]
MAICQLFGTGISAAQTPGLIFNQEHSFKDVEDLSGPMLLANATR